MFTRNIEVILLDSDRNNLAATKLEKKRRKALDSRISFEELISLCDQVQCVAKSGMPLDSALVAASKNLDRRLSGSVTQLADKVAAGIDFGKVINSDDSLPDVFKSVVQAGTRSGTLAVAVESLNDTAKRAADIHSKISEAIIYPAIVLMLVASLSVFVLQYVPAAINEVILKQGVERTSWIDFSIWVLQWTASWIWLPAILVVATMVVWVIGSRRAFTHQSGWWRAITQTIPWVGRLLQLGRLATFTDLMAIFVEQRVPLQEALPLAASVSGDNTMFRECEKIAEEVAAGGSPSADLGKRTVVPNLLRWQFASGMNEDELARSLRASSRVYRFQADQLADRCSVRLPVYYTLCIGGTATLIYALAVLVPWFALLKQLSF